MRNRMLPLTPPYTIAFLGRPSRHVMPTSPIAMDEDHCSTPQCTLSRMIFDPFAGASEEIIGRWFQQESSRRAKVFLATKVILFEHMA